MKQVGHVTAESDGEAGLAEEDKPIIRQVLSWVRHELIPLIRSSNTYSSRALVGMYADFFAHLDLFLSIGDQKHPGNQMV